MEWLWIILPLAALFALLVIHSEMIAGVLLASTPVAAFLLQFFLDRADDKRDRMS